MKLTKNDSISIGLAALLFGGVFWFQTNKADTKDVEKIEEKQDEYDDYITEQRQINTRQEVEFKYMRENFNELKGLLKQMDKKLEP
jgi:hypothetical protein